MPKVTDTRQQRAFIMLRRLRQGPQLHGHEISMRTGKRCIEANDAEWQVRNWLNAWITDEVIALVPELKGERRR